MLCRLLVLFFVLASCKSQLNFDAVCPGVAIPECRPIDSPEPDYYWRPYDGEIPKDALTGGKDSSGNITYIGQIPITTIFAALNPATIYPGKPGAFSSYFGRYHHDKDVKILCSRNKANFEWIQTKTADLDLLTDHHLIVGGFEYVANQFYRLYIGRVDYEGNVILGKVFKAGWILSGMKILAPDGNEKEYQSFEILAYKKRKAVLANK